ncbi:MAG: recd3 [Chlamydiales bacterium]|jgi:exodeoxyribonuclease V alpha subunit|nr:recd3 [Chlamydiales bacterium]
MELGYAHQLFQEKQRKGLKQQNISKEWPLLNRLLECEVLDYIDYSLAKDLLCSEHSEAVAAFVCYLCLAARSGHICVEINGNILNPDPRELFHTPQLELTDKATLENDCDLFAELVRKGVTLLPIKLLQILEQGNGALMFPIYKDRNRFYFQRNLFAENEIKQCVEILYHSNPSLSVDLPLLQEKLAKFIADKQLLAEQAQAIMHAAQYGLTLITGGPGTGKTYTAGVLIKALLESLTPEQKNQFEIMLSAPTGKATANLQASLQRATDGKLQTVKIVTGTLHRLLYRMPFDKLSADLILVDESSMIDIRLMVRLLRAIKPGARLILLGDRYQLPPVEGGSLFTDLNVWGLSLPRQPVIALKTCLRIESQPIYEFAQAVNAGDYSAIEKLLSNPHRELDRLSFEGADFMVQHHLIHYAKHYFPTAAIQNYDHSFLETFQKFRLLSPLRQGPLGIESLNQELFLAMVKTVPRGGFMAIPILIVQNDDRLELYNGDVGVLFCRKLKGIEQGIPFAEEHIAFFAGRGTDQPFYQEQHQARAIPMVLLPPYEIAYCLSVHKSQGSEFDHVLLVMPEGSELFGREVLYTAITRAKKKLSFYSSDQTLQQTVQRCCSRLSGLR